MPEPERLEIVASTRLTKSMWADIEKFASEDQRRPADIIRLLLGPAIRVRKTRAKRP